MADLSVVVPVYGCAACLEELHRRLTAAVSSFTERFEIVLVDDGSTDGAWEILARLAERDARVKAIQLSRNFGQHDAIAAGLDRVAGEWVVVMDGDLQDRPEEIPRLWAKAHEGWDVVLARRVERVDSLFKRAFSRAFYGTLAFLTEVEQDAAIANFGIYKRPVVEAVRSLRESTQYFPVMVRWVGFRRSTLDVEHAPRGSGRSTYDLRKLLKLGVMVCLAFSDRLLRLTILFGALVTGLAALFGLRIVMRAVLHQVTVEGWASLMVSIWMVCGLLIVIVGVVGLYVGRIFEESKQRPTYIVREVLNG